MHDMTAIEDLVNRYVDCWQEKRPEYMAVLEDNNFGCEHLQIFRNVFNIEDFSHEELCEMAVLLTRSLKGQINRDHKIFWSWCSFLTQYFHKQVSLFKDVDWVDAFGSLLDLMLAAERPLSNIPVIPATTERLKYVNKHLIAVCFKKHALAGAQSFAVLEGLLRRKASDYVDIDGKVQKYFTIMEPGGEKKQINAGTRMTGINDGLRLFHQLVTRDRDRPCNMLRLLEGEVVNLCRGVSDGYDLIDNWHNDLVHGREHWQVVTPIVMNMICLLVIDEIEPDIYDGALPGIKRYLDENQRIQDETDIVSDWPVFPPDLMTT